MAEANGPMIWIVEDDPSVQRFVADSLKLHGFRTTVFGNAEKAYGSLQCGMLPALMILDILLPGMSGVDLIRLMKQNNTWTGIPVVVVSVLTRRDAPASEYPEQVSTAYWVNKPFEAEALIRTINDILTAVR